MLKKRRENQSGKSVKKLKVWKSFDGLFQDASRGEKPWWTVVSNHLLCFIGKMSQCGTSGMCSCLFSVGQKDTIGDSSACDTKRKQENSSQSRPVLLPPRWRCCDVPRTWDEDKEEGEVGRINALGSNLKASRVSALTSRGEDISLLGTLKWRKTFDRRDGLFFRLSIRVKHEWVVHDIWKKIFFCLSHKAQKHTVKCSRLPTVCGKSFFKKKQALNM